MNFNRLLLIIILLILNTVMMNGIQQNLKTNSTETVVTEEREIILPSSPRFSLQSTSVQSAIINITHNNNFTNAGYSFITGNGIESDPYRIKDQTLLCNGKSGISIENVDIYFEISNYTIIGNRTLISVGIQAINVTHAIVQNNNIINFTQGFYGESSTNLKIINNSVSCCYINMAISSGTNHSVIHNNQVSHSDYIGINIINNATSNIVSNNKLSNNDYFSIKVEANKNQIVNNSLLDEHAGIIVYDSEDCIISNNLLLNNSNNAIQISSASKNCTVTNNEIRDSKAISIIVSTSNYTIISKNNVINGYSPLYLEVASCTTIFDNLVEAGIYPGIRIYSAENTNICRNTIRNMPGYAIDLQLRANYTFIEYNNIINTTFFETNSTHQASDMGSNNTFQYNYWNDWITPDTNQDYIVDISYFINGTSGNHDSFPLTVNVETYLDILKSLPTTTNGLTLSTDNSSNDTLTTRTTVLTIGIGLYIIVTVPILSLIRKKR